MKRASKVISLIVLLGIIFLAGWWLLSGKFTTTIKTSAQKTTLIEASKSLGFAVPAPDYLPNNYEIKEIYVGVSSAYLLISDKEIEEKLVARTSKNGTNQEYEFKCSMKISISWHGGGIPGGIKIPGKHPKITPIQGITESYPIVSRLTYNTLWWHWRPKSDDPGMYSISITANKHVSMGELVKVAESMRLINVE